MSRSQLLAWLILFGAPAYCLAQSSLAERDILPLQKSAEAGDRGTVHTLFVSYPHSDGAVTEDIDMILGNVARRHPRMFLEELKLTNAGHGKCTTVGNTLELTDQTSTQLAELRNRRKALLSVKDSSVGKLRDSCIRELDEDILDLAR